MFIVVYFLHDLTDRVSVLFPKPEPSGFTVIFNFQKQMFCGSEKMDMAYLPFRGNCINLGRANLLPKKKNKNIAWPVVE